MKENCAIWELSHLGVCASDKIGSWERIAVYSLKLVKNSLLQIATSKFSIKFSLLIYPNCTYSQKKIQNYSARLQEIERTNSMLIFKKSGSYQLCELSRITDCRRWLDYEIVQMSQDK